MLANGKPELLVPASSLDVLKVAVMYGADAVYIGGELYGLRAKAKNFSNEDIKKGQILLLTFEKSLESLIMSLDVSFGKNRRNEYIKIKFEEV